MRAALYLMTALLAGCAAVATTTFDPVEYDKWIEVTHLAAQTKKLCDKPEQAGLMGESIQQTVDYALLYSTTKIKSDRIQAAGKIVADLTTEFNRRYDPVIWQTLRPSTSYCQLKLTEIERGARAIAASLANKEM